MADFEDCGSMLRCFVHKLGLANRASSKLLAVRKVEESRLFCDSTNLPSHAYEIQTLIMGE